MSCRGFFSQDSKMKRMFEANPDWGILIIDATYKLTNLRKPLYLLLIIYDIGESEVVGMFLVTDETEVVITKMIQAFKDTTDCWEKKKQASFPQTKTWGKASVNQRVSQCRPAALSLLLCSVYSTGRLLWKRWGFAQPSEMSLKFSSAWLIAEMTKSSKIVTSNWDQPSYIQS